MIELDGTPNKSRLGANAILGVSLAGAKAAAESFDMPLYRYLGGPGADAAGADDEHHQRRRACRQPVDFQEFMILPVGARASPKRCAAARNLPHARGELKKAGHNTAVGDEGGFAPNLTTAEDASSSC